MYIPSKKFTYLQIVKLFGHRSLLLAKSNKLDSGVWHVLAWSMDDSGEW